MPHAYEESLYLQALLLNMNQQFGAAHEDNR